MVDSTDDEKRGLKREIILRYAASKVDGGIVEKLVRYIRKNKVT